MASLKVCTGCQRPQSLEEFFKRSDRPGERRSKCKSCYREGGRSWERQNPEAAKAAHKFKNIARKYGVTREWYENRLRLQNNQCEICATPFEGVRGPLSPCVDHNHQTLQVRAILCRHCNFAIGLAGDDPARLHAMAAYLQEWAA